MSKILCIYHGKCADGFTAAWAVHNALGDDVEFHEGIYGQEPPDVAGRDVVLVDFSYKRPVLERIASAAHSLLILDHHKTAAEDLAGLPAVPDNLTWVPSHAGLGARYVANVASFETNVWAHFDMERSGAGIAWDFFHRPAPANRSLGDHYPRPNLVNYVEDRDLWRFNLPMSREVNALIFSYDYTFKNWDYLNAITRDNMGVQTAADQGGAIERKHFKDVAELVSVTKRRMIIGGHSVPVANIPYTLTSDAGNLMAKGEPFAACYWDTPKGRVFSLRSTPDGIDVSAVAAGYGGGGHRNASGFQRPLGWEGDEAA